MLVAQPTNVTFGSDKKKWGGVFCANGFFVVAEVATEEEKKSAITIGKETLDVLLTSFSNVTLRNSTVLMQLLSEVKNKSEVQSLVIGLQEANRLLLTSYKDGVAYMMRGGRVGKILSPDESTSGTIQREDHVLLASSSFIKTIGEQKFHEILLFNAANGSIPPDLLEQSETLQGKAALRLTITGETPPELSITNADRSMESTVKRLLMRFALKHHPSQTETPEENKRKKTLLTIAVILIALLTLSIFFNISHKRSTSQKERISEALNIVAHQYEEANNLIDLNPIRARTLLSDSKLSISSLLSEFPKDSPEYRQINEWIGKISEAEVAAYKIYKLTAVPLFFDITLIKPGGQGDVISSYRETTVILDKKNKAIYTLTTNTKQATIVAGEQTVKDAQSVGLHGKTIYFVNNDGIVTIDTVSKSAKVLIKPDSRWGEIGALSAFGGNLYLLDKKNNTIWKYIATDFGFSTITPYLNADVRTNFQNANTMIIDGAVWVTNDNQLLKFNKGLGESFTFHGFSESIQILGGAYVSDIDRFLYILDKSLSRILIFDKDGVYQSQYQWEELKEASGFIANEEIKKIFVLIGSKIYGIDIK